ncbi:MULTISPECIES: pyridoxal phosphate-dependent aminotransferase [Mucilaginibacter]|uniref:Pyridoxal phosphate-dependent aminotransferase n=2 Tax=Mucilaginibacter rubeus TaxID=2027860 RepID=A0ABX7U6S7_9SPHI|nr:MULTISPECIES: pyridoxal phosphate-dependent aminotransferase [Mucilaginibacter]QTE41822.1 pyridoxal phosphate-dependent aminotransferase [Mucilaginibacter rubeus]QTE48426.1 pyridoxal phosphate-dependent aminotransferase [Mucilaginibacter rubeus]QTE59813.1 pyridoxal phosphate-dependent aminotransferase [Mucilaginibacter rubeus]QTE60723.1 pyridoxal phosphate-dependent aminotransferase [Mucilaginibacter rubeus]QTF59486.1 pyridoxal phosphate-dependent aminotransferase [Mucilaginibacter rubeus]
MSALSTRIQNLSESATIKMAKLGRELAAKGVDVISLSFGEPDFHTPEHIKEAAKQAMDKNFTYYTPVAGYPELRKAVVAKLKNENNLDYDAADIVVSTGAKQAIANAVLCLVNPGEEVIIPTPYWVSYSEVVKLAEGKSVFINTTVDTNFKITPEQLEAAITPNTKLFMFSSPCNPTGSVYSKDELEGLAKVFEKYPQVYILSDEIYEHINFVDKHESIAQFDYIKDRVVIINGWSKAFAMTGWRIGYTASTKELAAAFDKMQGQVTSGTCSITQRAGIAAYEGGLESVLEMREAFKKRRDIVYKLLSEIEGIKVNLPDGAFYFFPNVTSFFGKSYNGRVINDSDDLSLYLLEEGHVATVGGDSFGDPSSIRLSYAAAEDKLIEAMRRLKEALGKLA